MLVGNVVVSWSVRASGNVFAENVLMSGLTKNSWRVTKRVE